MGAFDANFQSMVQQINSERSSEITDVDDAADDSPLEETEQEEVLANEDDEEPEEEEEESEEEEEEDAPSNKNKVNPKGKVQEEAPPTEFPLYEISKDEVPQHSLDDVYSAWYNDTMQKGVKQILGEDGVKEYKSIDEVAAALGPAAWNRLERQAQQIANDKAGAYKQQVVDPFLVKKQSNEIMSEVNNLIKMPQLRELPKYLPRMAELNTELKGQFPSLEKDPVRAIPLLYMLAREEELAGTVKKIAKEKQKSVPGFEKGGVDRNITTKKKRDERDSFMDNFNKNKKKVDALAGIFALPKTAMVSNK